MIGCGGGGGGGKRSTNTSTGTTSGMVVDLPAEYGRVEVNYLTGEGRAAGDLYLEITRQTISDGATIVERNSLSPIRLRLSGFQTLTSEINVPFGVTTGGRIPSLNFTDLLFDPNRILIEGSTPGTFDEAGVGTSEVTDVNGNPGILPYTLDARIRVFPGRTTTVPLRVSTASFYPSESGTGYTFDVDAFKDLNYETSGTDPDAINKVASRLSDFVRFPLSGLPEAERPVVRDVEGNPVATAAYAYFSGDNYALSDAPAGNGAGAYFQEVGDVFSEVVVGKWSTITGINTIYQGTYDLRDALPSDPTGVTRIVSTYGGFRDYNRVLKGGGAFEMVMFPNSSELYTFEGDLADDVNGRLGDIVAFTRDASGKITHMYFGAVDLGKGTFELFPIFFLGADPGDDDAQAARLTGTVTDQLNASGGVTADVKAVRKFTFTFGAAPAGLPASGTATVFRA